MFKIDSIEWQEGRDSFVIIQWVYVVCMIWDYKQILMSKSNKTYPKKGKEGEKKKDSEKASKELSVENKEKEAKVLEQSKAEKKSQQTDEIKSKEGQKGIQQSENKKEQITQYKEASEKKLEDQSNQEGGKNETKSDKQVKDPEVKEQKQEKQIQKEENGKQEKQSQDKQSKQNKLQNKEEDENKNIKTKQEDNKKQTVKQDVLKKEQETKEKVIDSSEIKGQTKDKSDIKQEKKQTKKQEKKQEKKQQNKEQKKEQSSQKQSLSQNKNQSHQKQKELPVQQQEPKHLTGSIQNKQPSSSQIQPKIKPYNKVSLQPLDLSKYTKQSNSLTVQQFFDLCQSHDHSITLEQAQEILNTYGNQKQISTSNVNSYFDSLKYQHILDLKLDIWRQFNSFRNQLSEKGIHYKNSNGKNESHDIVVGFKSGSKMETLVEFGFKIGDGLSKNKSFKLEIHIDSKDESIEQSVKGLIEELKTKEQVIGQLLKCFQIAVEKQGNKLKLLLTSANITVVTDIIEDIQKYIQSLGQGFKVEGYMKIEAAGKLSDALGKTSLVEWLLKGILLNCKASGSEGWLSVARKYLSLTLKEKDRQFASHLFALKNSKVNVNFKAPENAGEFLGKLGIAEVAKKMGDLKDLLKRKEGESSELRKMLDILKKRFLPLLGESLVFKTDLPFFSFNFSVKGDEVDELIKLLI